MKIPCNICTDPTYCVSVIGKCEEDYVEKKYKVKNKIKKFKSKFEKKTMK